MAYWWTQPQNTSNSITYTSRSTNASPCVAPAQILIPLADLQLWPTSMRTMSNVTFEQFTQYEIELKVPKHAVQQLDENVLKGR